MRTPRLPTLSLLLVVATLLVQACSQGESRPLAMDRRPVTYLINNVAPCLPANETAQDPCPPGTPPRVETLSVTGSYPRWPSRDKLPTFADILLGKGFASLSIPHIVVRGTVQADTTRCELYPTVFYNFMVPSPASPIFNSFYHYLCFVDIRISEYIVGEGPAELTVSIHREGFRLNKEERRDWPNIKDRWIYGSLQDPQSRTAVAYEGKELILFLRPALTRAVEIWEVGGSFGVLWFVQRHGDEIRAVAEDIVLAHKPEHRRLLDRPLTELVQQIKTAAEYRQTVTSGVRVGEEDPIPFVVADANYLHDFYGAVGAVYDGEDATVLPPPVPVACPRLLSRLRLRGRCRLRFV